MAEAYHLPYEFVDYLTNPGLLTSAGNIPLKQYLCKTNSNGGNDSATSLIGKLRWMKDGGAGQTMNSLIGGGKVDLALKGQGSGDTFIQMWEFMFRNKEQLKKLKVDVCARRKRSDTDTKVVLRTGNVFDLYFKTHSDKGAIEAMIEDRFFGIDCIGFTANYLMYVDEWDRYHGGEPSQWPQWFCKENVDRATDIKELDFLLWGGHIAIVDYVWEYVDDHTVEVDICQSSSGDEVGPQCNERVRLRETKTYTAQKRRLFHILDVGDPGMPVTGHVYIMRRSGFFW